MHRRAVLATGLLIPAGAIALSLAGGLQRARADVQPNAITTYNVTTFADDDSSADCVGAHLCSLRSALALAAVDGSTAVVQLVAGTYNLDDALAIRNGTLVTITGAGPDKTFIRGGSGDASKNEACATGDGGFQDSVLEINSVSGEGTAQAVTLSGLTIECGHQTLGTSEPGGGIESHQATLTLDNVRLRDNHADESIGGGVFTDGPLTIKNGSVIGGDSKRPNTACLGGGVGSAPFGLLSSITESTCTSGDAAKTATTGNSTTTTPLTNTVTIDGSQVVDNVAAPGGGGVFAVNVNTDTHALSGSLTITNSTISGNSVSDTIGQSGTRSIGGVPSIGGGVFSIGPLTISSSTLSKNAADDAGGLFTLAGTPASQVSVSTSTLEGNSAFGYGGGILEASACGTSTFDRLMLSDNRAGMSAVQQVGSGGGGLMDAAINAATVSFNNLEVTGNQAGVEPKKAVTTTGNGVPTVDVPEGAGVWEGPPDDSTLLQAIKSAALYCAKPATSAAVTVVSSTVSYTNTTLDNNKVFGDGGGFYLARVLGSVTLTNLTIDSNTATVGGGGIATTNNTSTALLDIINSTIARNTAALGGGIFVLPGGTTVQLTNTIAGPDTSTQANADPVCFIDLLAGTPSALVSKGHNLTTDATGTPCGMKATQSDVIGKDPLLGALADNSATVARTATPGAQGTAHMMTDALLTGSPAIDAADDKLAPATDERAVKRPQGAHSDIGAFEVLFVPAAPAPSPSASTAGVISPPNTGGGGAGAGDGGGAVVLVGAGLGLLGILAATTRRRTR